MSKKNKLNYYPWKIKIEEFPKNSTINEQIKFMLGFGVLAPSGHNSQPWKFQIEDNSLNIFVVPERALPASDPSGQQLCIGVGCLVENFCIAANYYGFVATVKFLGDILGKSPIVSITVEKSINTHNDDEVLINFITQRVSNRNKYQEKALPDNFIKKLQKLSTEQVKIFVTSEPNVNKKIIALVIEAQIRIMENTKFRQELSELMKPNFTSDKIGMPGFAFGLPLPISMLSSTMVKHINMSKLNKKTDKVILKNTPSFIVIATLKDNNLSRFEAGRIFEKVWLMAVSEGLSCSPNAAPIADKNYSKQLQLLINQDFIPQIFSRIGFANKTARHTPRLNVNDLTMVNT